LPTSEPTGELRVSVVIHVPAEGLAEEKRLFDVSTTGATWSVVRLENRAVTVRARDGNGELLWENPIGVNIVLDGVNSLLGLRLRQVGPDVEVQVSRHFESGRTSGQVYTWTAPGMSLGAATSVTLAPRSGLNGTAMGHLVVMNRDVAYIGIGLVHALHGHYAESASDRIARICSEEQIPATVYPGLSEPLDVQGVESLPGILDEAAAADMGVLFDSRATTAIEYRPRVSHYNQTPVVLDYQSDPIVAPFEPTDDDDLVENDVTVTRADAGSYRAVQLAGPMAATPPPDGIGRYDASYTLSLADDAQTEPQANWRLHMGTLDELRYPKVSVAIHDRPELAEVLRQVDIGDRLQVTNLPEWLPPNTADMLVQCYEEWLDGIEWLWTANGTPGSSWSVGVADDKTFGRADTAGSELVDAVGADDVEIPVLTTDGPLWIEDQEHFPFDVNMGGEIVTVIGVRPLLSDDFNRGDVGEWDFSVWDGGYWNSLVWGE